MTFNEWLAFEPSNHFRCSERLTIHLRSIIDVVSQHHHQQPQQQHVHIIMSVEAYLTRELDIRFIDARSMVNEAKITLGIQGYPTLIQNMQVLREAIKISEEHNISAKRGMQRLKVDLERVKSAGGSSSEFIALDAPAFPNSSRPRCGPRSSSSTTMSTDGDSSLVMNQKKKGWFSRMLV
jgi:hypothetical protein